MCRCATLDSTLLSSPLSSSLFPTYTKKNGLSYFTFPALVTRDIRGGISHTLDSGQNRYAEAHVRSLAHANGSQRFSFDIRDMNGATRITSATRNYAPSPSFTCTHCMFICCTSLPRGFALERCAIPRYQLRMYRTYSSCRVNKISFNINNSNQFCTYESVNKIIF